MTKQEMIDKIYEVIADKTLSFGCMVKSYYDLRIETISDKFWKKFILLETLSDYWNKEDLLDSFYIIWHPVMIWDVLDWGFENESLYNEKYDFWIWEIFGFWKEKRKPIDNQSEECITFIYNLIKDETN